MVESSRPVVVELAGAPGAGKTTLMPAVIAACRDQGFRPYTVTGAARPFAARTPGGRIVARWPEPVRGRALWALFVCMRAIHLVGFALGHAHLSSHVVVTQLRRPPEAAARERRVVGWFARLGGAYAFLTARGGAADALVIDEGFLHRAVQLHASEAEEPNGADVDAFVSLIPRPDVLVYVCAAVDDCLRRVEARGPWRRFQDAERKALERFVANAHATTHLAVGAARRNGWTVVDVRNAGDVASVGRCLRQRVGESLDLAAARGSR